MNGATSSIMPQSQDSQQQTAPQMPQSPGGTTPTFPTQGEGGFDINSLIKMILSAQGQRKTLARPVPRPIPGQISSNIPGQPGEKGHDIGQAIASIGQAVQQGASQFRQAQLAKAESEWNQFNTALESDPSGQKATLWLVQNKAALKGMSKALNQDWLNPEKTTVYKQALENMLKQQGKKAEAKQGLMAKVKELIGRANQPKPQLSPQQDMAMASEIMGKAPMVTTPPDSKDVLGWARLVEDDLNRQQTAQWHKEEMDERHQEHTDTLQFRRDQLSDQMEAKRDQLKQSAANEEDKKHYWDELIDLRRQQLAQSKELALDKLSTAQTPKDLQKAWDATLQDIRDRRAAAYKDTAAADKVGLWGKMIGSGPNKADAQDTINRSNAARQLAEKLGPDVISGRMDKNTALDKVYSVYDSSTKIASMADVTEYAKSKGVSPKSAQDALEKQGVVVY